MQYKKLDILYTEYSSIEDLGEQDRNLCREAIEAQRSSYAPYSGFNVGAALLLEDGTIVRGSNQENAASPSGLCAERTAMFAAGALHPGVPMVSLAIVGGPAYGICPTPATPCGACRQVMAEYQKISGRPISVILVGKDAVWKFDRIDDLLPLIFDSI